MKKVYSPPSCLLYGLCFFFTSCSSHFPEKDRQWFIIIMQSPLRDSSPEKQSSWPWLDCDLTMPLMPLENMLHQWLTKSRLKSEGAEPRGFIWFFRSSVATHSSILAWEISYG